MDPGTVAKGTLDATVMVLVATKAAVALKNTSTVVEAAAVVVVGDTVTLLTAPVREPIA